MKELYERADLEVVELSENDVITTSEIIPCTGPNETPAFPCVISD